MPPVPVAPPVAPPIAPPITPAGPLINLPKAGIISLIPTLLDILFPAPTQNQQQEQDAINKAKSTNPDFSNGGETITKSAPPFTGGQCIGKAYDVNMGGTDAFYGTYFLTGIANVTGPIQGLQILSNGIIKLKAGIHPSYAPDGLWQPYDVICTPQGGCSRKLIDPKITLVSPAPGVIDNCGNPPALEPDQKEAFVPPYISPDGFPVPEPILPVAPPGEEPKIPTAPEYDEDDEPDPEKVPPIPGQDPLIDPSPSPEPGADPEPVKIPAPLTIPQDLPLTTEPLTSPIDTPITPGKPPLIDKPVIDIPIIDKPITIKIPGIDTPISFDPKVQPKTQPETQPEPIKQTPLPDLCELMKNCVVCPEPKDDTKDETKPKEPLLFIQVLITHVPLNAKIILGTVSEESVYWAGYFQILYQGLPFNAEIPIRRKTTVFSYPNDPKYSYKIIKADGYTLSVGAYVPPVEVSING